MKYKILSHKKMIQSSCITKNAHVFCCFKHKYPFSLSYLELFQFLGIYILTVRQIYLNRIR